jgi:hypothetical protein
MMSQATANTAAENQAARLRIVRARLRRALTLARARARASRWSRTRLIFDSGAYPPLSAR